MTQPVRPDQIDAVIHERVRLAIVSALAVSAEMTFNKLKDTLKLSDGNLSAHAQKLEDAGYIRILKSFQGKRPLTRMQLTAEGRRAFKSYLDTLGRIIDQGERAKGAE